MESAKIRHISIVARDTEALAAFYVDAFGLKEVHRDDKRKKPDGKIGVFLTDGYINLAILPLRLEGEQTHGLHHFGLHIEDTAAAGEKLSSHGVDLPKLRPGDRPFAEHRAMDPEGNIFDLSEHGWDRIETGDERAKAKAMAE